MVSKTDEKEKREKKKRKTKENKTKQTNRKTKRHERDTKRNTNQERGLDVTPIASQPYPCPKRGWGGVGWGRRMRTAPTRTPTLRLMAGL